MRVLTDQEVTRFPVQGAVGAMRRTVLAAETGESAAPARLHAAELTFTVWGTPETFGFRAYHTRQTPHDEQVVVVWDASGRVSGVAVGSALGALATDVLARPGASRLGLIGSGVQARAHALAVACVRPLTQVLVHSRDAVNRERLALELRGAGLPARAADTAQEVCAGSDLLTLATNSPVPVVRADWVRPGTHVCTLGPKEEGRHEFPPELARRSAVVVTDSLAQPGGYPGGHVLAGERVRSLGSCLLAPPERGPGDVTLFLSVGLAGTEVLGWDGV